jgi:hypothetical protein
MKKKIIFSILAMAALLVGTFSNTNAQRIIEPTEGFINQIIKADTANGAQKNNVYIFRRGKTYYYNGTIANIGYPITLKAEDGSGALPIITNWPDANAALNKFITSYDDAYFYNLVIDGVGPNLTTGEPDPYYLMNGQLLNASAAGKVFVIDGCILLDAGQVLIRSNSGARKVLVTNTILANSGQLSSDNIGNGRIIDIRNGVTDSIIFRNCTMVNTYDRILRHYGAAANSTTAFVKYIELDHNTIVHNLGAYGFMLLGDIKNNVKITNNLFYNPMTLGDEPVADPQRLAEVKMIGEIDSTGTAYFPLIIDQTNANSSPKYVISNNAIVYDAGVKKYFSDNKVQYNPILSNRIDSINGKITPAVDAAITLKNIPNNMLNIMNWYHPLAVASLGGGMITDAKIDMDRRSRKFWADSLDCSYSTTSAAFKGSDGLPVGSNVWKSSVVTGVNTTASNQPNEFHLYNNYPNPFNPSTKIQFSVPEKSNVAIVVFNSLGQEVARIINQELSAGSHSVTFNANKLSSGVYICKLSATSASGKNFTASQKMLLMK